MYMYKFKPILKTMLWGGEKIVPYKRIVSDQKQVGESWELSGVKGNESVVAEGPEAGTTLPGLIARHGAALLGKANFERFGEEFPLLIKFIDARQDLSIQVHPDDELAWKRHRSKGKTEMWYVVATDEGAHLRSGFAKRVTPAEYAASVEDNTITDLLADYAIRPGDVFFLPAGRVHSIGAGAFIAEIQQTSDITYRIYDAATPTATRGSCTPNWPKTPSTTPCCPTTARTTPRPRTARSNWCRVPTSPRRSTTSRTSGRSTSPGSTRSWSSSASAAAARSPTTQAMPFRCIRAKRCSSRLPSETCASRPTARLKC